MSQRIKKDDVVTIISGDNKGKTGKVLQVLPKKNSILIEGIGTRSRHVKPSQLNPRGGTKDIHIPTPLHKVKLADPKAAKKPKEKK